MMRARFMSVTFYKESIQETLGISLQVVENENDADGRDHVVAGLQSGGILIDKGGNNYRQLIRTGDQLLVYNGINCSDFSQTCLAEKIRQSRGKITMLLFNPSGLFDRIENVILQPKLFKVSTLGLQMEQTDARGGVGSLRITGIERPGLFDESLLAAGDCIISINNVWNLRDESHALRVMENVSTAVQYISVVAETTMMTTTIHGTIGTSLQAVRRISSGKWDPKRGTATHIWVSDKDHNDDVDGEETATTEESSSAHLVPSWTLRNIAPKFDHDDSTTHFHDPSRSQRTQSTPAEAGNVRFLRALLDQEREANNFPVLPPQFKEALLQSGQGSGNHNNVSNSNKTRKKVETEFSAPDRFGQRHPIETPQLIVSKLQAFDAAVAAIPKRNKIQVAKAESKCPHLLTPELKLLFLRCECYRVKDAVKRWVKYWERRESVFGETAAYKPLTIENCMKDEDEAYFAQNHLFLFESGKRTIKFVTLERENCEIPVETSLRGTWYTAHADLQESITAQRMGMMSLYYLGGHSNERRAAAVRAKMMSLRGALPMRASALFGLHPPRFIQIGYVAFKHLIPHRLKNRFHFVIGNERQALQHLEKIGFEQRDLPVELGGEYVGDLLSWYRARKAAGL